MKTWKPMKVVFVPHGYLLSEEDGRSYLRGCLFIDMFLLNMVGLE